MICTWCGKDFELVEMDNDISRKEAKISGFCQECQDATFGKDKDDN